MWTSEVVELARGSYTQALLVAVVLTQWTMATFRKASLLHIQSQRLNAGGHCDSVVLVLQPHALAGGHGSQSLRHEGEHADLQPGRHGLLLVPGLCRPGQASPAGKSQ